VLPCHFRLIQRHAYKENREKALEMLEGAIGIQPDHMLALHAKQLITCVRVAWVLLDHRLKLRQSFIQHFFICEAHSELEACKENREKALEMLEGAIGIQPDHMLALHAKQLITQSLCTRKRLRHYKMRPRGLGPARSPSQTAPELHPAFLLFYMLGTVLVKLERPKLALPYLQRAVELNENDTIPERSAFSNISFASENDSFITYTFPAP
jgi:tetratricopeptide (TPR) repeat protein